jgi:hypothetical protein
MGGRMDFLSAAITGNGSNVTAGHSATPESEVSKWLYYQNLLRVRMEAGTFAVAHRPSIVRIVQEPGTTAIGAEERAERDLWGYYLTSITEPRGPFPARQVETLKNVWRRASEQMGDCPIPITQPTDDGSLLFAWDKVQKYIDVEAAAEGGFHWYFRNRETGEVKGSSDEPVADLGAEFFEKLAEVVASPAESVTKAA